MSKKTKPKTTVTTIVIISLAVLVVSGCKSEPPTEKALADTEKLQQTPEETTTAQPTPATQVRLTTSLGDIVIELNTEKAPISTANFLKYVEKGHYDGTIFHRVIPGFMIQGGGYKPNMRKKVVMAPIRNEADNGLKNLSGTIAMARTNYPHSATCQFFINLVDNTPLDYTETNPGYAVFGKVVEGMDIVRKIASVKTAPFDTGFGTSLQNVPAEPVIIESAKIIE